MKILMIDNYDSFTFNLVHLISMQNYEVIVKRNDELSLEQINEINPKAIVISPGPCSPNESGISIATINKFYKTTPILGVCLGHQAIGQVFGATIEKAKRPEHGKVHKIEHNFTDLFQNIPTNFKATRYHSLVISNDNLPSCLEVIANSEDGHIMAIKHRNFPIYGVQFHPESIETEYGDIIIKNFLSIL